jgi:hypothetical protein
MEAETFSDVLELLKRGKCNQSFTSNGRNITSADMLVWPVPTLVTSFNKNVENKDSRNCCCRLWIDVNPRKYFLAQRTVNQLLPQGA